MGEFDRASKIVECLDIESIEIEIAGLESWISDMDWWEQERLQESIDLAQLRIDDLSEHLSKSAEYHRYCDQISPDDSTERVTTKILAHLQSEYREYREYRDTVAPDLIARYGTAMDSLSVPNDAAIRYRLEMIGSTEFEPRRPELPKSLEVLPSPETDTEEDFLRVLRELKENSQRRRALEPKRESGLHLTDLPKTLISEETAPAESDELRVPTQPTTKSPSEVGQGTNDNKAGDILLPEMDFSTKEGRSQAVDNFIAYIFKTTGKQISKTSIWKRRTITRAGEKHKVGYGDPSGFKDWQRGEATKRATEYFEAVLRLKISIIF
jgi:hypothetical protein